MPAFIVMQDLNPSTLGLSIAVSQLTIGVADVSKLIELAYLVGLLWQLGISFMGFAVLVYHTRIDETTA